MNVRRFKSCSRCSGDLIVQNGEWGCIQCGLYYYPKADLRLVYPGLTAAASCGGNDNRGEKNRTGGLAGRIINAVVRRANWLASIRRTTRIPLHLLACPTHVRRLHPVRSITTGCKSEAAFRLS